MDIFQTFQNLCSALGLSGAAGLNAYIPLLTIAIMERSKVITLAKPYDVMGEWWVIVILIVLLIIELVVDKVPGADHINDVISTAIRPTAGALIFASQMSGQHALTWVHPGVWAVIGIIMGGSVHVGKAVTRPVVNVGTAGFGAPVLSTIENLASTTLSILAIFIPILAVILMVVFGFLFVKIFRKFFGGWRKDKRISRVRPASATATVTVDVQPTTRQLSEPAQQNWGGGV